MYGLGFAVLALVSEIDALSICKRKERDGGRSISRLSSRRPQVRTVSPPKRNLSSRLEWQDTRSGIYPGHRNLPRLRPATTSAFAAGTCSLPRRLYTIEDYALKH